MRHLGLLVLRLVLGGYVAAHGAQKLFGSFGGRGLEATAKGFEQRLGLRPGQPFAALTGVSELGGGILTATGIAHPLGPVAIASSMAAAAATHVPKGPFSSDGGYELPATNLAAAVALMAAGPGPLRLGPRLPRTLALLATVGAAAMSAYSISQIRRTQAQRAGAPTAAADSPSPIAAA